MPAVAIQTAGHGDRRRAGIAERRPGTGAGRGDGEDPRIPRTEQAPEFFRMRITVQKVGDGAKVSDVAFVS